MISQYCVFCSRAPLPLLFLPRGVVQNIRSQFRLWFRRTLVGAISDNLMCPACFRFAFFHLVNTLVDDQSVTCLFKSV